MEPSHLTFEPGWRYAQHAGGLMHAQGPLDSSYRHVRIRHAVACAVLAILLMAARPAGAPLDMRLHIDASLRTSAVYHLACLGGSISCLW